MVSPLVAAAAALFAIVAFAAPADALGGETPETFLASPEADTNEKPEGYGAEADMSWAVVELATVEAAADVVATDETAELMATAEVEPEETDKQSLAAAPEPEPLVKELPAPFECLCLKAEADADVEDKNAMMTAVAVGVSASGGGSTHGGWGFGTNAAPVSVSTFAMGDEEETPPAEDENAPVDVPVDSPEPAPVTTKRSSVAPVEPAIPAEVAAAVAVAAAAAGAGGGWLLTAPGLRHFRYLLRRGWIVALYAKVTKDRLLHHRTRQELVAHIGSNPGVHVNEIRSTLGLGHGTAAHHLHALEANGLIVSVRSGRRRCYFVPGTTHKELSAALNSESARRVFRLIEKHPGILQRELANALGVTPTAVIFQVRRLQATGAVEKSRVGREVAYFARAPQDVPRSA